MCMIWQAIVWNGQQKAIALPPLLALNVVVLTTSATATRAVVGAAATRIGAYGDGSFRPLLYM